VTAQGSELSFVFDSGIRIPPGVDEAALLDSTICELTGNVQPKAGEKLLIENLHSSQAVTVHVVYLNDSGESVLSFLVILYASPLQGSVLLFAPFDYEIPATYGENTAFRFIVKQEGTALHPMTGKQFGSGLFVIRVTAVQAGGPNQSVDRYRLAEKYPGLRTPASRPFLFPYDHTHQMKDRESRGIDPESCGLELGFSRNNLHIFNAQPRDFPFLTGRKIPLA